MTSFVLILIAALPFVVHSQLINSELECQIVSMLFPEDLEEEDCCLWDGISCGAVGRVRSIHLSNHSLVGSIPTEIGLLSQLTVLDLSQNEMTGIIPSDISNLTNLKKLELYENKLTGSLPTFPQKMSTFKSLELQYNDLSGILQISSALAELTSLRLDGNALTGPIPDKIRILSNLKTLNLDDNELKGSIPTTIGDLVLLQKLRLNSNFLTGRIPTEIGKLSEIESIDFDHNDFTGQIPSELSFCINLSHLSLASNALTGSLPENLPTTLIKLILSQNYLGGSLPMEIWALEALEEINIHNNALSGSMPSDMKLYNIKTIELGGNELTGSIPSGIGILAKLDRVDLHDNFLKGSIPTTIFQNEMSVFDISDNELTGEIPSEIGMLSNSLIKFQANANFLDGTIPTEVGLLNQLENLELHHNQINGEFPREMEHTYRLNILHVQGNQLSGNLPNFQYLTNLQQIVLGENYISGQIPEEIGGLHILSVLDLQKNQMTGQVPSEVENCSKLNEINLHGNMFTGHIPSGIGDLVDLKYLDASSNLLTGQLPTTMQQLRAIHTLRLENNNMSGSIPFSFIQNMRGLKNLSLAFNQFDFTLDANFINFVSHMEVISLTGNNINGSFRVPPSTTGVATNITQLHLGRNCLSGTLPSASGMYLPYLTDIDLSAEEQCPKKCFRKDEDCLRSQTESEMYLCEGTRFEFHEESFGGLEEEACVTQLGFYGPLPFEYVRFSYVKKFNLSGNALTGSIPAIYEGALPLLEELDLSNNEFSGRIPFDLASIGGSSTNPEDAAIYLANNNFNASDALAPHSLCELANFDLRRDHTYCPRARSYLQSFFEGTKGSDWRNNRNWEDEYQHHCNYHGVVCNSDNSRVLALSLSNNGLSGRLPAQLGELKSLRRLILQDNDIRGIIPTEISELTNLNHLDLAYNLLDGEIPDGLSNIAPNLESLKLHGNRLHGAINGINHSITETSASKLSTFVADCGHPSEAESPVVCEGCTMCCNANGVCEARINERRYVILSGVESSLLRYTILGLGLLAFCCVSSLASSLLRRARNSQLHGNVDFRRIVGHDSVYSLLLREKWSGRIMAVLIAIIQVTTFYIFYEESILDFEREDYFNVAWIYSWWCPRNGTCEQQIVKGSLGWTFFTFLMAFHLVPDFWNGYKTIWMVTNNNFYCFVAGYLRLMVACYAAFVSVVFNIANASSNTDLIINAVILLFIADFDELCFRILQECFPGYLKEENDENNKSNNISNVKEESRPVETARPAGGYAMQKLERLVDQMKAENARMKEENEIMKKDINALKSQVRSLLAGTASSIDYADDYSDTTC